MTLREVICILMVLNKAVRVEIKGQNYIIFKKFVKEFTLNKRLKKGPLILLPPDMLEFARENMRISKQVLPKLIQPFVFSTDSGVINDEYQYSMHQLFGE